MAASTVDREEGWTTYLANGFRNHGMALLSTEWDKQIMDGWDTSQNKTKEWDNLCVISLVNNQEPNMHNNY
jgi:hypothetical protein